MTRIEEGELRRLVRELVSQTLPQLRSTIEVRSVSVADDVELADFVASILELAEQPANVVRMRAGLLRFTLSGARIAVGNEGAIPRRASVLAGTLRIEKGAVTERVVQQAAHANSRLVLGAKAVITPLAQECARKLGVEIERIT